MDNKIAFTEDNDIQLLLKCYLPSNADIADICNLFALFSDVTRVKILSALALTELCVTDIADYLCINQTTVSHQLKLLRDANMVKTRRNGKVIYYQLSGDEINEIMLSGVNCIWGKVE